MAGTQDQQLAAVGVRRHGTTITLDVSGELDIGSAPQLEAAAAGAVDSGPKRLVVDLRAVTFLDSTALGVLIATANRAERIGTSLFVVRPAGPARQIFALCGVDDLFAEVEPGARRHPAGASEDGPRFLTDWTR
jgi:anti-sigma B factor antagonist